MLEEKQGQFWNLHQILHETSYPDFRFSSYFFFFFFFLMIEDFQIKLQLLIFSPENPEIKKETKTKIKIRDTKFC